MNNMKHVKKQANAVSYLLSVFLCHLLFSLWTFCLLFYGWNYSPGTSPSSHDILVGYWQKITFLIWQLDACKRGESQLDRNVDELVNFAIQCHSLEQTSRGPKILTSFCDLFHGCCHIIVPLCLLSKLGPLYLFFLVRHCVWKEQMRDVSCWTTARLALKLWTDYPPALK